MSTYTMQLKAYIEGWSQSVDSLSNREKIERGRTKLFDFKYPIFDETYREEFETKFIRTFYMTEIGFETEGLFKFHLETWLMVNMPYFNKMFESEILNTKYDPLTNSKIDVTHNRKTDKDRNDLRDTTQHATSSGTNDSTASGTTDSTASGTSFARDVTSNTPDDRLTITTDDGAGVIEYASSIEEKTGKSDSTSKDETTGTSKDTSSGVSDVSANDKLSSDMNEVEDFVQHRIGKIGVQTYPKLMEEFRNSFLRIENQIFKEMREKLFMLVY